MIWLEAVKQAQAIRRRETSSLDLVREYLERIDRLDPVLRSYVTVDAAGAVAVDCHHQLDCRAEGSGR